MTVPRASAATAFVVTLVCFVVTAVPAQAKHPDARSLRVILVGRADDEKLRSQVSSAYRGGGGKLAFDGAATFSPQAAALQSNTALNAWVVFEQNRVVLYFAAPKQRFLVRELELPPALDAATCEHIAQALLSSADGIAAGELSIDRAEFLRQAEQLRAQLQADAGAPAEKAAGFRALNSTSQPASSPPTRVRRVRSAGTQHGRPAPNAAHVSAPAEWGLGWQAAAAAGYTSARLGLQLGPALGLRGYRRDRMSVVLAVDAGWSPAKALHTNAIATEVSGWWVTSSIGVGTASKNLEWLAMSGVKWTQLSLQSRALLGSENMNIQISREVGHRTFEPWLGISTLLRSSWGGWFVTASMAIATHQHRYTINRDGVQHTQLSFATLSPALSVGVELDWPVVRSQRD